MNVFESTQSSKSGAGFRAQLHRIFDYVGVPSRFANAQLQIRADLASTGGNHWFHTPFNRISRFSEPGLINLNTSDQSRRALWALEYVLPADTGKLAS